MSDQIILTISRQPGCGGLEIGQRLARRLSAVYIDKRTVTEAAHSLPLPQKGWLVPESYVPEVQSIISDEEVHEKEGELLLELADGGPAVVVGRGGFHRFRAYPNAVHVFLFGDDEYRLKNYKRLFLLDDGGAKELLHTADQATIRYIQKVTGKDMLDAGNYDLCINVSKLDFNRVAEIILDYIHYRFQ